jgi:mannan endo-1,4-beta-mannosidase
MQLTKPFGRRAIIGSALVFVAGAAWLGVTAAPRPGMAGTGLPAGATIAGKIGWQLHERGNGVRVAFLIDGMLRWTATAPPYRYGGPAGRLDTRTLADGMHRVATIVIRGRYHSERVVTVTVRNGAASRRLAPIYWGAYIEGRQTYSYLYGGSWGNAPWDAATWDRFEANAGKRVSIVHYGQPPPWEQPFVPGPAKTAYDRGAIPAIDLQTGDVPLRAIAAGRYDASIAAWARAARAWRHPLFLLLDVEMNGAWEPYSPGVNGNTPMDFIDMWRHVHDLFDRAGASNVTWVWCPNIDSRHQFTPYEQLYPGDRYVDWTGLDGYDADGTSSFASLFGSSYSDLLRLAATKPIMISQVGAEDVGGSKAPWIIDALSNQLPRHFRQVKAILWFNWRIYEKNRWFDWEIESSAESRAAFAQAVSSSYYLPRGDVPALPALTSVVPPP